MKPLSADIPTTQPGDSRLRLLVAVAASSAAGLMFEVAITRVFAVAQFYHFAFLAVSLALLGFGASGSVLAAFPRLGRGGLPGWHAMAVGQAVTTVGAYVAVNTLPFDSFSLGWDRTQIVFLAAYYLALAVPFFFGGLLIATLLTSAHTDAGVPSNRIYAASLVGSGVGAVAALAGLEILGGEGTILAAAALAMGAAVALGLTSVGRSASAMTVVGALALAAGAVWVPGALQMNLSPYKGLSSALRYPGSEVTASNWDLGTRIDLVQSDGIRSLPGLSVAYRGDLPTQGGIAFDGDDLSPVIRTAAGELSYPFWTLNSLAFRLHSDADVLVLEPHGGLDVAIALAHGARSVVAVEPHAPTIDLIRQSGPSVYDDRRVEVAQTTARSYVEATDQRFDVIDLALTAPYRPVASGAYSLAEDYGLTVQAFETYLARLTPGGTFTAMRWVQVPPSEEIRLLATAAAALRNRDLEPRQTIVMLRSYSSAVVLARPDGFSETDLRTVRDFAEQARFDIVVAPTMAGVDPNRFNVVVDEQYSSLAAALIADPGEVIERHEFDISPPTDDHPFFGHYFRWSQAGAVVDSLGRTWQPFGGAGYLVLVAMLVISTVAAIALIGAPMAWRRRGGRAVGRRLRWWTLGYFSLLGVGFLFVEIPLIQQLILPIGQPASAFAVVLFSILVSSGVGSALSHRVHWRAGALAMTASSLVYPLLLRLTSGLVLASPWVLRIGLIVCLMAPLGCLMGIMFPKGISLLEDRSPELVPWAWAINGTVSVISTAAAAVLALSFGFSAVLMGGAAAYGLATILLHPRLMPPSLSPAGA